MKGGDFEWEVSRELSLWITNKQRDDIFGRSDGSGSRFTSRKKAGKTTTTAGDITFIDPLGIPLMDRWCVECKTGYGSKQKIKNKEGQGIIQTRWDMLDCIDSKQKDPFFVQFWKQCSRDAELSNKMPVLIFRRNRREMCVAIRHSYFHLFSDWFGDFPGLFLSFKFEEKVLIMTLKDFLAWAPSDWMTTIQEKTTKLNRPKEDIKNRLSMAFEVNHDIS